MSEPDDTTAPRGAAPAAPGSSTTPRPSSAGRVQNPAVAEPERDVVGALGRAVRDEIAGPLLARATGSPAASCCQESRGTSRPVAR